MPKVQKYDEDGNRLQTYPKGSYDVITAGDPTNALIDIGIRSLQTRPPKYPPTKEGLETFKQKTVEYFKHLKLVNEDRGKEPHLIADIESWCCYLQITRKTLWNYRNGRDDSWSEFIDRTKDLILAMKKDQALRFKSPPMVFVFDAVNNFGYQNTNQIQVMTDTKADEKAQMEDKLTAAGLRWDPIQEEYVAEDADYDG